ncbi:hypothetical protein BL247_12165 [Ralstonia solanacearum]|uniref:Uncharacterized protein n=1 Tax=Ralstonia solanacearum TaxID=305 RepID=A0A0K1ZK60_RALSL|nr:hypothetical protein ACH51_07325 [Ralstonia solanacearum]API74817.1 hypothetical protein AC251_09745 [Ralstonia pseudosolanacearum]ASL74951.1 hypothetical protein BC350_16055 [Ralstonia pseudosolanacearum]AYA46628.1 hypothetical protein RSP824_09055 [Ralstonia pseudosolanacearum]NKA53059.1 hypothetical protein [Ralstonia solanacearum]
MRHRRVEYRLLQEWPVNINLNSRHPWRVPAGVCFRLRAPHPGAGIRHALHPSAAYHLFNQGRVNLAVLRRGGGTHFK